MRGNTMYQKVGKRLLDLVLTIPILILLTPIFILLALLVRLKLGSPFIFRQQRPGLDCQPFTIFKFRTMTEARDAKGNLLPDQDRITTFGQFMRNNSLDELPELVNVLRGEMSLVGPRPLIVRYLDRYSPQQMRRHEVLPGITGWAQINGRNNISWEKKLALDVWYVDHQSLWLDLRIIATTFWSVLTREGISREGYFSSPEFTGSAETHEGA